MKKDIAERWADELESGKYEQGKTYLNRNGKFCCLGVLCEMSKEELNLRVKNIGINTDDMIMYDSDTGSLPQSVMKWADIKTATGRYGDYGSLSLAWQNDHAGKSFKEIAEFIRKEYKIL